MYKLCRKLGEFVKIPVACEGFVKDFGESLPRTQKSCSIISRQVEYRAGTYITSPQKRGSLMVAINMRSAKWT